MTSHYEQRLDEDLRRIREAVREVAEAILTALERSTQALLDGDRALAYETILGDHPINRQIRAIDRLCHAFVARHLPSAGHLRFVSAVLRLTIELERIGDYAVTICRESVQLSSSPPAVVARGVELMASQSRSMLQQAVQAFAESNAELARGTKAIENQVDATFGKVLADLLRSGKEGSRPLEDVIGLFVIFNVLERVSDQAKNICEDTIFAVTGESKPPKVYRVLFLDDTNADRAPLAAACARKAFPESGSYDSAALQPETSLDPRCQRFLERHGLERPSAGPGVPPVSHRELSPYNVVVSLGGDCSLPRMPFATSLLIWDVGPSISGKTDAEAEAALVAMHHCLAVKIRELMETLRGDGAG